LHACRSTLEDPLALILERLPLTLALTALGLLGALGLALPLALLALRLRALSLLLSSLMALLQSLPTFFLGVVLLYALAVHLPLFPAGGFPGWDRPLEVLRHLFLPALTLALARAAILFRMARASLLEVMGQDYIRTARAKGVPEGWVLLKHALRPASLPLVTVLGLEGGFLLTGAGYRARIRNHGHSCFLCEIVIRSQFHTTYEPEA
jgi:ABC-type dipeptide/oligopeptide/nickel transport systems, permease components